MATLRRRFPLPSRCRAHSLLLSASGYPISQPHHSDSPRHFSRKETSFGRSPYGADSGSRPDCHSGIACPACDEPSPSRRLASAPATQPINAGRPHPLPCIATCRAPAFDPRTLTAIRRPPRCPPFPSIRPTPPPLNSRHLPTFPTRACYHSTSLSSAFTRAYEIDASETIQSHPHARPAQAGHQPCWMKMIEDARPHPHPQIVRGPHLRNGTAAQGNSSDSRG
jgi:hypothetical protein